jgi:HD-GYP domain-containing protein (c-di-GMP phosphodiesterase class II)
VGVCELCQRLCGVRRGESRAVAEGIKQVWVDSSPRIVTAASGCPVMIVPVIHRRRPVAIASVCFLPQDLGTSEAFARACDRQQLDRTYMAQIAAATVNHPASEARHWMQIVQLLLAQALGNAVAREELASFSNTLGSTYEELSLLYRLSAAMKLNAQPKEFFNQVCSELMSVINVRAAVAVLSDNIKGGPGRVVRAGTINLSDDLLRELSAQLLGKRATGTLEAPSPTKATPSGSQGASEVVPAAVEASAAIEKMAATPERAGIAGDRGLIINTPSARLRRAFPAVNNLLAVPLEAGELSMGVLLTINKVEGEFDSADMKLIHSVGGQVAVFLANNHLYDEMQDLLMGVLHVLTASIDAKDQYTCGHSQRVALISRKLGEMCGFDAAVVENVYLSGLLHDIGKIGVPESVLCKPGKLSDAEFEIMKRHPVIGANILANIRQMKPAIPGVLYHHERLDGRGYPQGLLHQEIPMEGRIVGLADSFDAMTSSRTYREALPLPYVIGEIHRCAGTQFDPQLVDHLVSLDLETFMAELRQAKPMVSAISGMIRSGAA